jgi:hypothetical protein
MAEIRQRQYTAASRWRPCSPAALGLFRSFCPVSGVNRGREAAQMPGFGRRLLTFCLPYNLLAQFLDQNGNKPYKLRHSSYADLPGSLVCEW